MPSWRELEDLTVTFGIVPIVLHLCDVAIADRGKAAALASEVNYACARIDESASVPDLWRDLQELLAMIFVQPVPGMDFIKQGNAYKERGHTHLQAIAYLGATIQPECDPRKASRLHLYFFAEARLFTALDWAAYRRVFLRFLERYWQRVIEDQPFRFSPPRLYREQLDSALAEPVATRAQAILSVATDGLRVVVPEKYREWIRQRAARTR